MKFFRTITAGGLYLNMDRILMLILGIYIGLGLETHAQNEPNCLERMKELFCKKLLPNGSFYHIENLTITNLRFDQLDFTYFHHSFQNLEKLTIIGNNNSRVRRIEFPKEMLNIKELRLNHLQITESLLENMTEHFKQLEILDISYNNITNFPRFPLQGLREVYMIGNKWNCSKSLEWTLDLNSSVFKDLPNLKCFKMPHNNKPILAIAQFIKTTAETCTPNCSCSLIKCITNMEDVLEPIIEVNCSFRGFNSLPETFPAKTKILRLEGNSISDLGPLRTNIRYRDILDLYLDSNKLTTITVLEGSYWLTHFRVFSLRNNEITELPVYALHDALKRNVNMPDAVRLNLGGNPYKCDCVSTPRFKEMLLKYTPQIRDISNIKCAEGDENSLARVIELSRSSVCHSPSEYTVQEALDLLNAVLGLLIIFILGKLAYDYYTFKKTGRLPWIVTKMP